MIGFVMKMPIAVVVGRRDGGCQSNVTRLGGRGAGLLDLLLTNDLHEQDKEVS